ncbi:hypothetical protein J31TS4_14060 [Paenibacillus sp. J31TS4]|uniref:alpha/beta fold hydrolase n=1 Tax=Paenibacillus sp. J31TS4 TaxID=2807195 RepID=UPI001B0310D4|nr:alpha/beta fold hydrolase [Paenibacillus sp. J31TS4]GIP38126.1 hypothetical protein J31TS4_14060 [Paenibacillus sp. J31TS4]
MKTWTKAICGLAACSVLALGLDTTGRALAAESRIAAAGEVRVYAELVPLRQLAEAIGAAVVWNQETYGVTVTRGNESFRVAIGAAEAQTGNKTVALPRAAELVEETTMVPLSLVRDALHADVSWTAGGGLIIGKEDTISLGGYVVHLLQTGRYEEAGALMSEPLRRALPVPLLQQVWGQLTQAFGAPGQLMTAAEERSSVHRNAVLVYKTDKPVPLELTMRFRGGKLDDLYLPASAAGGYQTPAYDRPEGYTEKEIMVGKGDFALPGTLTLPRGDGPFPAVVLVHGSGPNDRDESIGGYKPFRDLAVGLADKGIAVLRYEKRTREHPFKSSLLPDFSVREETIDDALLAVQALQEEKAVRADRIFVLGHSQGGMLVPRILEQDTPHAIAGSILLAAPSGPLEDLLLWQLQQAVERAKAAGQPAVVVGALEAQAAQWKAMHALLKDPGNSISNLPKEFAVSNPYWWFDFRNYEGAKLAARQRGPMLLLQGENDSQVPAEELNKWKQALGTRTDVTYRSFPKLNHFFVPAEQPSTGEEYAKPGNVPGTVIDAIAGWIAERR